MKEIIFEYDGIHPILLIKQLGTNGAWWAIAEVELDRALEDPKCYQLPGVFKLCLKGQPPHDSLEPDLTPHDSHPEQKAISGKSTECSPSTRQGFVSRVISTFRSTLFPRREHS